MSRGPAHALISHTPATCLMRVQNVYNVVRPPADIIGPTTKAPVIRDRLAPPLAGRLFYRGVALLALDLHDQEAAVGHLDYEIREILPRYAVRVVGDHQTEPVVFHPGSDLLVLIDTVDIQ
jgi:hypothetical protein